MSAKTRKHQTLSRAGNTKLKARRAPRLRGEVDFRQVEGKVLKQLAIDTSREDQVIILAFQDNTELCLSIDPGLTVTADYSDWKTGNQRVLKRWPAIRS